jgi:ppGpp synthetase/RelA/SpoT-type nucleotidyltranferase
VIVSAEVQQWYTENIDRLKVVEKTVRDSLDHYVSSRSYLYSGRIKSLDSLSEKVDLGLLPSFRAIDDAYAGTIVIPTYADEDDVRSFLQGAFSDVRVKARGVALKPPDQFRFDATRAYCRLAEEVYGAEIATLQFEVQILSAFDYAWQITTHDLVYKNQKVDWRRARVAAQMKALVEQLDAIGQNFDAFVETIAPSEWPEISARNAIIQHIDELFERDRLPSELKPAASSRLAETVVAYLRNDRCRNDELGKRSARSMTALDEYLNATAPHDIPRSLTLAQLLFGIMYRSKVLSEAVRQRILRNPALVSAFPELNKYPHIFEL